MRPELTHDAVLFLRLPLTLKTELAQAAATLEMTPSEAVREAIARLCAEVAARNGEDVVE